MTFWAMTLELKKKKKRQKWLPSLVSSSVNVQFILVRYSEKDGFLLCGDVALCSYLTGSSLLTPFLCLHFSTKWLMMRNINAYLAFSSAKLLSEILFLWLSAVGDQYGIRNIVLNRKALPGVVHTPKKPKG